MARAVRPMIDPRAPIAPHRLCSRPRDSRPGFRLWQLSRNGSGPGTNPGIDRCVVGDMAPRLLMAPPQLLREAIHPGFNHLVDMPRRQPDVVVEIGVAPIHGREG